MIAKTVVVRVSPVLYAMKTHTHTHIIQKYIHVMDAFDWPNEGSRTSWIFRWVTVATRRGQIPSPPLRSCGSHER